LRNQFLFLSLQNVSFIPNPKEPYDTKTGFRGGIPSNQRPLQKTEEREGHINGRQKKENNMETATQQ